MCAIVALASSAAGAGVQPSAGPELTKPVRKALDDQFDRWKLAALDPALGQCRPADGEATTPVVAGDLNGDGVPDIALAIHTSKGVHLVAVITRLKDNVVIDVDTLGETTANGYIGIARRGTSYKHPTEKLEDFFAADTVTISKCGERVAYLWTGLGFRKIPI